ncbi:MAG: hypothetical protein ABIJ15_09340 [bacterium]
MRKKGFILLILLAALWWWHFYKTRSSSGRTEILTLPAGTLKADAKAVNKKERELETELIKKAENAFLLEYGRKPENLAELIDTGFLSPGIYSPPAE